MRVVLGDNGLLPFAESSFSDEPGWKKIHCWMRVSLQKTNSFLKNWCSVHKRQSLSQFSEVYI